MPNKPLFLVIVFQVYWHLDYLMKSYTIVYNTSGNCALSLINYMNIIKKSLPFIIIVLIACTPAKVIMNVDAELNANAVVYEIDYPDSLADKFSGKRLNVSFGPYQVTDADVSWTSTETQAENPDPLLNFKKIPF